MTTRAEHLQWSKDRALAYVDENNLNDAVASMGSDLTKHAGTENTPPEILLIGMMEIARGPDAVRNWINGFN